MSLADEIAVKLGLNSTQFKTALKEANADVQAFKASTSGASGAAQGFSHELNKMLGAGRLLKGLFVGLGIESVQMIVGKIVDHYKQAAETAKEIEKLSAEAADATIAAARAQNSDETNYQLLLQDRRRLEEAIANNRARTDEQQKQSYQDQIALGKVVKEQEALRAKIEQENIRKGKEAADAWYQQLEKVYNARIRAEEELKKKQQEEWDRRVKAAKDEASIQKEIKDLKFAALTPEKQVTALLADQKELTAQITYNKKQGLGYSAEQRDLQKVNNELAERRKKLEEATAAALLKQAETEKKVAEAKAVGISAGLTDSEQTQLAEYIRSDGKKGALPTRTGGAVPTSGDFTRASDAELAELIRRTTALVAKLALDPGTAFSYGNSIPLAANKNLLLAAQREEDFRRQFRDTVSLGGEAAARRSFAGNPLEFDRVYSQLTQKQDKLNTTLQTIDDRLQAAGFKRR